VSPSSVAPGAHPHISVGSGVLAHAATAAGASLQAALAVGALSHTSVAFDVTPHSPIASGALLLVAPGVSNPRRYTILPKLSDIVTSFQKARLSPYLWSW
jgi:hypothetical protein